MTRAITCFLLLAYLVPMVPASLWHPEPESHEHFEADVADHCGTVTPMENCGCASNCGDDCSCCNPLAPPPPFEGERNLHGADCGCGEQAGLILTTKRLHCWTLEGLASWMPARQTLSHVEPGRIKDWRPPPPEHVPLERS